MSPPNTFTQLLDATGSPASPGPGFTVAPDGGRLSVSYRGAQELIIFSEQAAEPLLRIADGVAAVEVAGGGSGRTFARGA